MKQTEIGEIPENWQSKKLSDVFYSFAGGGTPSRGNPSYWNGEINWVTVKDLTNFNPNKSQETITKLGLLNSSSRLIPSNTLITSTRMALGKAVIYNVDVAINQDLKALFLNKNIDLKFMYFWFQSKESLINELGGGSTVKGISLPDLKKIDVLLPDSEKEQKAISEVLTDTDNLIQATEQLINKKQLIKTATMQNLLTGKIRLAEFDTKKTKPSELGEIPSDWDIVKLGDLTTIKTGSRNNQDKVSTGQYPFFVRSATVERINSFSYNCEAILIPGEGGIGSIFHYINGKFDAHQRVYVIREFKNCDAKFIYYAMMQSFGKHAMENSVKATVDSLRLPTFQNFEFTIPSNKLEQTEIALTLSDMDKEISELNKRLTKLNEIKQGLMQDLLTGKIRLTE